MATQPITIALPRPRRTSRWRRVLRQLGGFVASAWPQPDHGSERRPEFSTRARSVMSGR